jgi:hypothetical protein
VGSSSRKFCAQDADCGGDGGLCNGSVCVRLDLSRQTLPTGGNTPGALDELDLSEPAGLGSGTADLFTFMNGRCDVCDHTAASTGPVDWSGDGSVFVSFCNYTDVGVFANAHAQADLNGDGSSCNPSDLLHGHTDWPDQSGRPFNYRFACQILLPASRRPLVTTARPVLP